MHICPVYSLPHGWSIRPERHYHFDLSTSHWDTRLFSLISTIIHAFHNCLMYYLALTNAGGAIADMWNARERGVATALYSTAPYLGPGEYIRYHIRIKFSLTLSHLSDRSNSWRIRRRESQDWMAFQLLDNDDLFWAHLL